MVARRVHGLVMRQMEGSPASAKDGKSTHQKSALDGFRPTYLDQKGHLRMGQNSAPHERIMLALGGGLVSTNRQASQQYGPCSG